MYCTFTPLMLIKHTICPLLLGFTILSTVMDRTRADLSFESVPRSGYPHLHPLGTACLKKNAKTWHHGRSEHFLIHGKHPHLVTMVEREAEHAWYKTGYLLGLKADPNPIHIVLIEDPIMWKRTLGTPGETVNKIAAHIDGTIFLFRPPQAPALATDLAHEIVHARIAPAYPDIPLWLEEGLALNLGIEMTRAFHKRRGILTEALETNQRETGSSNRCITSFTQYPKEIEAFYRASRQSLEAIRKHTGDRGLKIFVDQVATGKASWESALTHQFKVAKSDIVALKALMQMRSSE